MILGLVLIPTLAGLASFLVHNVRVRRGLLVVTAAVHTVLMASLWLDRPAPPGPGEWLGVDELGLLFLSLVSILFLAASIYALGYLRQEEEGPHADFSGAFLFANEPEGVFIGCLLLFLASMTLVTLSQHLGLLWVTVEATTLASSPLIYFHRHHRSLEATWKYLLICSVGIALALLGNFILAAGAAQTDPQTEATVTVPLILGDLIAGKSVLAAHPVALRAAFLLLLVGYGTKMGLAPMHTWLPDAHSESPSLVSALLSGALLNCAFLGILRSFQIVSAAGQDAFARPLLIGFGVVSMAVAAVFILGQGDFKRMLAYSSVEHMGILALGIGLGGVGVYGGLLHAVNHSLTKGCLFLTAGNILAAYRTKSVPAVHGILRLLPATGLLWLLGFLAITGSPPFGTFLSEFNVLRAALDQGRWGIAVGFLALLALVFIGMASIVLPMTQGRATAAVKPRPWQDRLLLTGPPILLGLGVLLMGVYVPPFLDRLLGTAASALGGKG